MDMADGPVEAAEFRSGNVASSSAGVLPHAKPWRRLVAREIDVFLMAVVVLLIIGAAAPNILIYAEKPVACLPLLIVALMLNALVLTIFGNSPGRKILGIYARPISVKERPGLLWNIKREARVWLFGLGIGFPLAALITMFLSFRSVRARGSTGYDIGIAFVEERPIGLARKVFAILCWLLPPVLIRLATQG